MSLIWPGFLLLLILIPLLIVAYVIILRRRRRFAVRFSSLSLLREALPHQSQWRRHLPFALFLLALAALVIALARPVNIIPVPTGQTTIILAIDVSGSMRQRDILPTRLEAAKTAALNFVQRQKAGTQIGIVAFSNFGEMVQPPTTDTEELQSAIESLTVGRRTAIGSGILTSLDAISQIDKSVAPSTGPDSTDPTPTPVPKGAYAPDIIVLLTDGVSNTGISPLDAAQQAADRGVRVYTIGYGTAQGGPFGGDPGTGNYGGGGGFLGGGGRGNGGYGGFQRGIDETTLKQVSSLTGGEYYPASSAQELEKVFSELPTYLITRNEISEISFLFALAGAIIVVIAIALSIKWHPVV